MNTTLLRTIPAHHPATHNLTVIAAAGPLLLAAGWILVDYLPNSPLWIAASRVLPAGLILLGLRPARPTGIWWSRSIVLGAVNFAAFFSCQATAVHSISAGVAATIAATQTLLVPFGAVIVLATPLRGRHLLAATAGIVGVALLVLPGLHHLHPAGITAAAGAAVCNALGLLLTRRWGHPPDVHHLTATGWQLTAGGVLLLPVALLTEGVPSALSADTVVLTTVVAVATACAFAVLFGSLHAGLPPTTISRLMLMCPLGVTATDWVLNHQPLTPLQLLGAALIVGSITIANRPDISQPGERDSGLVWGKTSVGAHGRSSSWSELASNWCHCRVSYGRLGCSGWLRR